MLSYTRHFNASGQKMLKTIHHFLRFPFETARSSAYLLLILGLGAVIVGYLQQHVDTNWLNFLDNAIADFYANAGTELISIAITVLIIDRANRKQSEQERLQELALQMGSTDNAFAIEAVRILTLKNWLTDGSLNKANLVRANLINSNLQNASLNESKLIVANLDNAKLDGASLIRAEMQSVQLEKASLVKSNLLGANLYKANMKGAILTEANLSKANLSHCNLQGAFLDETNLTNSNLRSAELCNTGIYGDLRGADLTDANLEGAHFWGINLLNGFFVLPDDDTEDVDPELLASQKHGRLLQVTFDQRTVLPDGSFWTPDTDMKKFTSPINPGYFRPGANDAKKDGINET
jgi:uncharacterized protein YjbI with pentapeptide repeats